MLRMPKPTPVEALSKLSMTSGVVSAVAAPPVKANGPATRANTSETTRWAGRTARTRNSFTAGGVRRPAPTHPGCSGPLRGGHLTVGPDHLSNGPDGPYRALGFEDHGWVAAITILPVFPPPNGAACTLASRLRC